MAAIFHLLRVTSCWGTRSPEEGAFSNSQCLVLILWEQLCFFSIHNPTLANSSSSILSIAIYTQSICLAQIVLQSIRLISPTDFWKFPLECPTGTSYSGLTHPNQINLSATHLEAKFFQRLNLYEWFTICTISKTRNLNLIIDYPLSLTSCIYSTTISGLFYFLNVSCIA